MKPIVVFGTCRERMAYWEHVDSVTLARQYLAGKDVATGMVYDYPTYIRLGRQRIVKKFLQMQDATHLCFADSDNVLSAQSVWQLLKDDLPIVGALYFSRRGLPEAIAKYWSDGEMKNSRSASQDIRDWMVERRVTITPEPRVIDTYSPTLLRVDVIGFGCILIRRDVLEQLVDKYGDVFGGHDADVGEDVYFCRLAAQEGIPVYVDVANIVGHIGHYDITLQDFMQVGEWKPPEEKEKDQ